MVAVFMDGVNFHVIIGWEFGDEQLWVPVLPRRRFLSILLGYLGQ